MNKTFGCFLVAIGALSYSAHVYAATPVISAIADQTFVNGDYTYTPSVTAGDNINWSKAYGPDDVSVDPISGKVEWEIPVNMPDESFHIGVRASNSDGYDIETWVLTVGSGNVIYIGPTETLKTLKDGMAAMESGDTLIMRNGTWDANPGGGIGKNTIPGGPQKLQKLPSGDANQYTSLMAEDPGQVIIDGDGYTQSGLISLFGSYEHPDWGSVGHTFTGETNYIAIKGLVLVNSNSEGVRVAYSHNVKLIDIGVGPSALSEGSYPNVYIFRSDRVLIEGMYVWGHGRYKIQFKDSSESVVRRSLVRMDDIRIDDPIGGFIAYCSKNIVFQNNIVIDSDSSNFWFDYNSVVGAFGVPATNCYDYPEGIVFQDSLHLNGHVGYGVSDARNTPANSVWENIVAWDLKPARHYEGNQSTPASVSSVHSGAGATFSNRMTVAEVATSPGWFLYSRSHDTTISNSIFYRMGWVSENLVDIGDLIRHAGAGFYFTDNNVTEFLGETVQSGTPVVSGTTSVNPDFRYITKLPDGSSLRQMGQGSNGVGAELLFMRGKSGTLYGQSGYNSTTAIPMWPFPGEEQMHSHLNDFSYTGPVQSGGTATLTGSRGFAISGQSLSHYVWTYLDTIAPPFRVRAVGEDKSATVVWDKPLGIGFSPAKFRIYRTDTNPIQLLGERFSAGVNRFKVEGLTNGNTLSLGVSAVAGNGQESDIVYPVEVTPSDGSPVIVVPEDDTDLCVVMPSGGSRSVAICL